MAEARETLRVFISYARRDASEFAEELLCGLEAAGFEAFLDRHDIAAGEDWEARLRGLIQSADTVLFVVTPAAVASERCTWEVKEAEALSKRVIPVVALDVPEEQTPVGLKRLNYIFFTAGHSFSRGLLDLVKALRVDLDWIREHTRFGELAGRWRDRSKAEALLLRGSELAAAKAWLAAWQADAPEPTDLQRAFINASDEAEQHRNNEQRKQLDAIAAAQSAREAALKQLSRRTTIGLIAAGALTATAGGLAYWGVSAEGRFRRERAERARAEAQSIQTIIAREAARTDIQGQLSVVANVKRQGRSAMDEPSAYSRALLQHLEDRDASLLEAIMRTGRGVSSGRGLDAPGFSTDLNGDLYLKRPSQTRRRIAVVAWQDQIGGRTFTAPQRDANAWATFMESCGFAVRRLANLSARAVAESVQTPLGTELGSADSLMVFYFAGGGASMDGDNYLLAADSRFGSREEVQSSAVPVAYVEESLRSSAAASVLLLDTSFADFRLAAL